MINKYIKAVHDLDEIKFRLRVAVRVTNQIPRIQAIKDLDYLLNDSLNLLDDLQLRLKEEMTDFVDFFMSSHPSGDLATEIAKNKAMCGLNVMKGRNPINPNKNNISGN